MKKQNLYVGEKVEAKVVLPEVRLHHFAHRLQTHSWIERRLQEVKYL